MLIDLVMGLTALAFAALLAGYSAPLADGLLEGDDRLRERHPWVQAYEPQVGWLASETGRWWILRSWMLGASLAFLVVGVLLELRAIG
jgi:hypothetical protein